MSAVSCCNMHNRHCEPPSELCCNRCSEVDHPFHPEGVGCVWASDADVAQAEAIARLAGRQPATRGDKSPVNHWSEAAAPSSGTYCPSADAVRRASGVDENDAPASENVEDEFSRWLAADVQQRQGLRALFEDEGGCMKTIEIKGVWLIKKHAHLGGDLEVLVELPDGTHRAAISGYVCDDGPVSHYVHPKGIASAPVREFHLL